MKPTPELSRSKASVREILSILDLGSAAERRLAIERMQRENDALLNAFPVLRQALCEVASECNGAKAVSVRPRSRR